MKLTFILACTASLVLVQASPMNRGGMFQRQKARTWTSMDDDSSSSLSPSSYGSSSDSGDDKRGKLLPSSNFRNKLSGNDDFTDDESDGFDSDSDEDEDDKNGFSMDGGATQRGS